MAQQTYMTVLRKMPQIQMTAEYEASIKKYFDNVKNNLKFKNSKNSEKCHEEPTRDDIREFIGLGKHIWYNTDDKSLWVELAEENFMSSFTELAEELGINAYCGRSSQYVLNENECDEICRAAKYLLNKNYDDKIEECINSRFIKALGSVIAAYSFRRRDYGMLIVERESEDVWTIHRDNTKQECEDDELMKYGEVALKDLIRLCGLYLSLISKSEYSSDGEDEYRIIYEY